MDSKSNEAQAYNYNGYAQQPTAAYGGATGHPTDGYEAAQADQTRYSYDQFSTQAQQVTHPTEQAAWNGVDPQQSEQNTQYYAQPTAQAHHNGEEYAAAGYGSIGANSGQGEIHNAYGASGYGYNQVAPQPTMQPVHGGQLQPNTGFGPQVPAPKPKKEERIDSSQIPRWSPDDKTDEPLKKYYTRSGASPPPSTNPFIAIDEGNCSPRFIRMSTNYIAQDAELVDQTKLCIGAIIQPLAEQTNAEEPPPIRDFGEQGPIRCSNCRAYVNPFFQFVDHGKSFICNMCTAKNTVPEHYYCNLDPKGFRRDRNDRPELCRGSIDIVAPADYYDTPVTDPCYLFVVDASYPSLMTGLLDTALESIRDSVDELRQSCPRARVGIITYDQNLYFYSVKKGGKEPRLDVVADTEDPFVPVVPQTCMLPISDEKEADLLYQILELIPKVHQFNHVADNTGMPKNDKRAFGAATQAGAMLLEKIGGKLILVLSKLPDHGVGKLESRDDIKLYHTSKESTLLIPQGSFYSKLATFCAQAKVSVDIFACPNTYVDLATLSQLTRTTGGQIYYYNSFHAHKDGEAFHRDMYRNISRYTAFQAVMVIRCSKGLSVTQRYGNFFAKEANEMEIPVIHCDSSFGIMLSHDTKLDTKEACIQTALLYATPEGERRIRIHTISLPVTSTLCNLFRHSDLDTIINLSLKQAMSQILYKCSPKDARKALYTACIESLFIYRKYCSTQHSPGQLILPEPLKLLPLATLGMIKHNLFHSGQSMDERAFETALVGSMPTYVACSFVNPCLFSLTDMPDFACVEGKDGRVFLPPVLKLSSDSITEEGVYLLDDGRALKIWIGGSAPQKVTDQLFGTVQVVEGGPAVLQLLYDEKASPTSLNARVWNLITQLRRNCPSFKTLSIVTRNTHTGSSSLDVCQFFDHLIEDAARKNKWNSKDLGTKSDGRCGEMSYIDFLCYIHKGIQDKFF
ncbi:hypothetical protein AAMO2058_000015100 [Amorphochlora amoebiformis]|uniref:Uncharacterized protein n=1 Tax=Amorphochlora amoebiformis TaxID=1561963 RepID=A0A7S0DG31_9EUKA|mmetsp:Transcript_26935/g.42728  ORF Transcript_26935/g.42728 Transcript_26935/m.42728 type:complete len:966 (+) Transcript_26935:99-2996(+)